MNCHVHGLASFHYSKHSGILSSAGARQSHMTQSPHEENCNQPLTRCFVSLHSTSFKWQIQWLTRFWNSTHLLYKQGCKL